MELTHPRGTGPCRAKVLWMLSGTGSGPVATAGGDPVFGQTTCPVAERPAVYVSNLIGGDIRGRWVRDQPHGSASGTSTVVYPSGELHHGQPRDVHLTPRVGACRLLNIAAQFVVGLISLGTIRDPGPLASLRSQIPIHNYNNPLRRVPAG
jgi:hypothetical protein